MGGNGRFGWGVWIGLALLCSLLVHPSASRVLADEGSRSEPNIKAHRWIWDDSSGNHNGNADLNEILTVYVDLVNESLGTTATNVSATLSLTSGSGQVLRGSSTYPDIPDSVLPNYYPRRNQVPFLVQVSPDQTCGGALTFDLAVTYDGGSKIITNLPVIFVGTQTQVTASAAGVPAVLVDDDWDGINLFINVADSFTVKDLNVKLNITHGEDSDLYVKVTSPQAASAFIVFGLADGGQNLVNTVVDDESLNWIARGTAPYTGSYFPADPFALRVFDEEAVAGNWMVNVSDRFENMITGTVNGVELQFTKIASCAAVNYQQVYLPMIRR